MKLFLKTFFLFLCCLFAVFLPLKLGVWVYAGAVSACPTAFITHEEIRLFFAHPENIRKYSGQKGYLHFAEQTDPRSMYSAFRKVAQALGKDFKHLNWQPFKGNTRRFREIRRFVLNEEGQFKEEYKTMEGCARLATELFQGNMFKTFMNVSAVLDKKIFKQAGWQPFKHSIKKIQRNKKIRFK